MCCNKNLILAVLATVILAIIGVSIIGFCVNCCNQPNILQATNSEIQVGDGFTQFILNNNNIKKGNDIIHENNNPERSIVKSGVYLVNYAVTGSLETGGSPTSFDVSIYKDNILVPNSIVSSLVIPKGQSASLSGSILIEVNGSSVISLIGFSDSKIVYQDVIISVIKLS